MRRRGRGRGRGRRSRSGSREEEEEEEEEEKEDEEEEEKVQTTLVVIIKLSTKLVGWFPNRSSYLFLVSIAAALIIVANFDKSTPFLGNN